MQTSTSVLVIAVVVSTCALTHTVHMFALAILAMVFPGMDSVAQVCRRARLEPKDVIHVYGIIQCNRY